MNAAPWHFVVYWRQADWGFYHRRHEALTRGLADAEGIGPVLHLETISLKGLIANLWRGLFHRDAGMREAYRLQFRKAAGGPVQVMPKLWVKSILVLAFLEQRHVAALNRRLWRWQARRVIRAPVAVTLLYPPNHFPEELVTVARPRRLLADLVDDVPALESDPEKRRLREQAFTGPLRDCDGVFATSVQLAMRYGDHAPSGIEFLPNGVRVGAGEGKPVEAGASPTVLYVGILNRSLDRRLLEYLLMHNPEVSFQLVGPVERDTRDFLRRIRREYPNCRYLGPKRADDVRALMARADVLVNLKTADVTTQGNDSIKIYEYLGTGKPIVSTSMAPADRMGELLYVADEPQAFHQCLGKALKERDPARASARLTAAADNGWSLRISRVLGRLAEIEDGGQVWPRAEGM